MTYHITLEGRLPGLNELISSQGRPWWACRATKEKAMKNVMLQLRGINALPKFTVPITITMKWIEQNARRDRDNVSSGGSKIILDAMKQMGIIADDSRKWVKDIQHDTSVIDKARPRIEVQITEAGA